MKRENILKFLDREKCTIIDNELIDYAINLSQGGGDFNVYEDMLFTRKYKHEDDRLYYHIGLVAYFGLNAYVNPKDIDYLKVLSA